MNKPQPQQRPQEPQIPDGTWAITPEDKPKIREIGRKLTEALMTISADYGDDLHLKYIAGGFQYFMEIQNQKAKLIGDNFVLSQKVMAENGLGDKIVEPFENDPVAEASIAPGESKDVPAPTAAPAAKQAPTAVDPLAPEAPVAPIQTQQDAAAAELAKETVEAVEKGVEAQADVDARTAEATGPEAPLAPTE